MAMIKCPECEGDISEKAVFCPHCGYPMAENPMTPTYELDKGSTSNSELSTFLIVLAWLTWIGGLIIAIAGANITVVGMYRNTTEFSFTTFLTLFIPFIVYGALLYGIANLVQQIADTYNMVNGMKLIKKSAPTLQIAPAIQKPTAQHNEEALVTESNQSSTSEDSDTLKTDQYGWIIDEDPRFTRCPSCNRRVTVDYMKYRKACIDCGYKHVLPEK